MMNTEFILIKKEITNSIGIVVSSGHFWGLFVAKFELVGLHGLHRFEILSLPLSDILCSVL
jgi:hypothetical protein